MISLRNILLPTDFSDASLPASQYALAMGQLFRATVHVLHIIEDPVVYSPMFESYQLPDRQQFEMYAQDRLENWIPAEESEGCRLELQWLHGSPVRKIIEYARDCSIDLIVMGTHGRGGAGRFVLGSVAENVVRATPCPVLTVHAQDPAPRFFAPSGPV